MSPRRNRRPCCAQRDVLDPCWPQPRPLPSLVHDDLVVRGRSRRGGCKRTQRSLNANGPGGRPFAVTGLRLISVPARSAVGPPPQWSAELGPRSAVIRPRRRPRRLPPSEGRGSAIGAHRAGRVGVSGRPRAVKVGAGGGPVAGLEPAQGLAATAASVGARPVIGATGGPVALAPRRASRRARARASIRLRWRRGGSACSWRRRRPCRCAGWSGAAAAATP